MSEKKVELEVENDHIRREYTAWKAGGAVHTRIVEYLGGETWRNDTVEFPVSDEGLVSHTGEQWCEYAKRRFRELNDRRFEHEYTELQGELDDD